MTNKFSKQSLAHLNTCAPEIQMLCHEVLKVVDIKVICGHRSMAAQDAACRAGNSKVKWPNSKHNSMPSRAVDIVPYPVNWKDFKRFYIMGGIIKAVAHNLNLPIRWGGDWDGDNDLDDQTFNDMVHVELK